MGWKKWYGSKAGSKMNGANRRAVEKTCYVILTHAKQEVPHDEGTLMNSGEVFMHETEAAGVVSFGGGPGTGQPLISYALRWHEEEANFQKGRKRFYLRDPFNKLAQPTLVEAIKMEAKVEGF